MKWAERTASAMAHEARIRFHFHHGAVEAGHCFAARPLAGSLMRREFDAGIEDAGNFHVKAGLGTIRWKFYLVSAAQSWRARASAHETQHNWRHPLPRLPPGRRCGPALAGTALPPQPGHRLFHREAGLLPGLRFHGPRAGNPSAAHVKLTAGAKGPGMPGLRLEGYCLKPQMPAAGKMSRAGRISSRGAGGFLMKVSLTRCRKNR